MDLQLIKTFLEVSTTGSFGAAAGRLYVTQSAVSLRIHRLEDQLGRPLFDRTKSGVVLTAAPVEAEPRPLTANALVRWLRTAAFASSCVAAAPARAPVPGVVETVLETAAVACAPLTAPPEVLTYMSFSDSGFSQYSGETSMTT